MGYFLRTAYESGHFDEAGLRAWLRCRRLTSPVAEDMSIEALVDQVNEVNGGEVKITRLEAQ